MLMDTIVAIATPLQEGAISIIRVSGESALLIVSKIMNKDLTKQSRNTITYGHIVDQDEIVDEVLVSVFKAPRSFTREDLVEINCHGGVYLTRKILTLVLAAGARLAMPGEFTRRAFLNGRIDLTQAEAINDIIVANSETSATMAIKGIKGSVKQLITPLIESMLDVIAHIEVNIDYPEYDDVIELTNQHITPHLNDWLQQLSNIINKAKSGRIMKHGVKTVIVGKPNVGKSSLFNALLEEDKAIVTNIEGTTRDLVEGIIRLDNVTLHIIDTAGLRDSNDLVEQIGIQKTKEAIDEAELVILVLDHTTTESDQELEQLTKDKDRIIVYNKDDNQELESLSISALNKDIKPLIDEINQKFEHHKLNIDQAVLNNERQIGLVIEAYNSLLQAQSAINNQLELDLVTIDLQNAYTCLKEVLGQVSKGDLLDTLFENFCLGK